jgi:hypothetical protein
MSNYTQFGMLRKGDDDVYTLTYPVGKDAQFPLIDIASDMGKYSSKLKVYYVMGQKLTRALPGKYVAAALKNRSAVLRVQFFAAADYYTPARILAESEEVTGKKTRFFQVDSETYNTGQMGQEMLENHLFIESPG